MSTSQDLLNIKEEIPVIQKKRSIFKANNLQVIEQFHTEKFITTKKQKSKTIDCPKKIKKKIYFLIVDDNLYNIYSLQSILEIVLK